MGLFGILAGQVAAPVGGMKTKGEAGGWTSIDCCGQNGAVHLIFFSISADHLFHRRSGGGQKWFATPKTRYVLPPPSSDLVRFFYSLRLCSSGVATFSPDSLEKVDDETLSFGAESLRLAECVGVAAEEVTDRGHGDQAASRVAQKRSIDSVKTLPTTKWRPVVPDVD
jgi:hypothetical protein